MTKLTDTAIEKLEAAGTKRWTKHGKDRLYFNARDFGLELDYYNSGNICSAMWQGERISNCCARRLLNTKCYIDIETGSVHAIGQNEAPRMIEEAAQAVLESVLGDSYERV